MSTYNVRAVHWAEGWELHLGDDLGVTQVRTLDKAVDQVRNYVETLTGDTISAGDVRIAVDLDGLEVEVEAVRASVAEAEKMRSDAAKRLRKVVRDLRTQRHLSVSDTASVLGVSRGRISQIVK